MDSPSSWYEETMYANLWSYPLVKCYSLRTGIDGPYRNTDGLPMQKLVIFYSYVKLPEGMFVGLCLPIQL